MRKKCERKKMKSKLILFVLNVYMSGIVLGHDVRVHEAITSAAVSGSAGFAQFLQDNNISPSQRINLAPYPLPRIAARTNELPESFPGDPFDRTIVATAAALNLTLVTADAAMRDAGMCEVEFYPFKPSRLSR
jgi:hypothetical protein